jgi:ribosome-associated heat shock protein Hsp15
VRVGSVIALPLHDRVRVLRVLALPDQRRPAREARCAYEEIGSSVSR